MYDYKKDEEVDVNDEANDFDAINAIMLQSSLVGIRKIIFISPTPHP